MCHNPGQKMVDTQLLPRGIKDPVLLKVMAELDRSLFVPSHSKDLAFEDTPLPIGHHQTISQPYIVAYMTELLNLKPDSRVLDIGTGSGYQTAIFAGICTRGKVCSIEVIPELSLQARKVLDSCNYTNIEFIIADAYKGYPQMAPYDGILVGCAAPQIPLPLKEQLANGGRLIIPVGGIYETQTLILVENHDGKYVEKKMEWVRFVPMVGEAQKK
ncbi:protein-L-isoaspartate(D-aspartate) O-methyltransferase [Candidatus Riflebacteria bacterium]